MRYFLFLLVLLTTHLVTAQTHTFTASGGTTDWHTATNWSANTVPTTTSIVEIPDGFEVDISTSAVSQSITLSGSGTLNVAANLSVSEILSIEAVAVFNYEQGDLSAGTLDNFGTIRLLTNQQKEIVNTVINNHSRMDFIDSNNIDLSGTVVINNLENGVMDILANGGLSRQNGATTTLINDGFIKKYTENGDFGNFYMILDVINNNMLEVVEDNQLLFLSPQASLHNTSTGVLTGTGVFDITSSFINEGTVSPGGDEIGELTFINTFNLDGGILDIDIEDVNSFDKISVLGSAIMTGNINLDIQQDNLEFEEEVAILSSNFTINDCNFPEDVIIEYGCCDIYTYSFLCEPNDLKVKLTGILFIGVVEFDKLKFSITPNPISEQGKISLDLGVVESPTLEVFDLSGKKVKTISITSASTIFNRGTLADGMYFAQLISEGKVITTEKLILK